MASLPISRPDLFQQILDQIPYPVTHCTRDLRYLWVNRAYADWLGSRPEDIMGRPIVDVIGRPAMDKLLPFFRQVLAGEPVRYEEEVAFAGLGQRWIKVTYDPLRAQNGEVEGWVAMVNDVTAEQRDLAHHRAEEERFRILADQAPVMIWMSGPDKLCTWFNKLWLDFVGRPIERELGNGWSENVHPDDFARCLDIYVSSFDARQPFEMEYRLRRHDGVYRWVLDHGIPLFGREETFIGYIGSCIDMTDRRNAEEALREGHRRKDEFLATLAHELRNPLAPIRNAVEFLRARGPKTPELEWSRDVIERQARQLGRLVDDLLNLSRISLGKIRLEMERIPVSSFVLQAIETSRPLIEEHGHSLEVELLQEPVFVEGDLIRLSQVVTNLLNNAAKYTPRGGQLRVTVRRGEGTGRPVFIQVADTGIGIPKNMLGSIFDLFVQVGDPREQSAGGLGIGLTLAHKVIALHGGTIQALSDGPGQGSSFTIRLPTVPAPLPVSKPARTAAETKGTPQHRILIVDDNSDNADSLAALLRLAGHEIITAYGAQEALARAEGFGPSVVLLDIGMPEMSGYELARRIRSETWGRSATLIALTGWGQDEDRRRSEEAGVDHHLTKPVELTEITRLLPESVPVNDPSLRGARRLQ